MQRFSHNLYAQAIDQILATDALEMSDDTTPLANALQTIWSLTDYQNTVRSLVSRTGGNEPLDERLFYDQFGQPTNLALYNVNGVADGSAVPLSQYVSARYCGREFDYETKMQYNGGGYSDPSANRWIGAGSANGDYNMYRFSGNALPGASDSSAIQPSTIWGAFSSAYGYYLNPMNNDPGWGGYAFMGGKLLGWGMFAAGSVGAGGAYTGAGAAVVAGASNLTLAGSATYLGTQFAISLAETGVEYGANSLFGGENFSTLGAFGKNLGINIVTGGIGSKGKLLTKTGMWLLRQGIEISGDTAFDVYVNGNNPRAALMYNTAGSIVGEAFGKGLIRVGKRLFKSPSGLVRLTNESDPSIGNVRNGREFCPPSCFVAGTQVVVGEQITQASELEEPCVEVANDRSGVYLVVAATAAASVAFKVLEKKTKDRAMNDWKKISERTSRVAENVEENSERESSRQHLADEKSKRRNRASSVPKKNRLASWFGGVSLFFLIVSLGTLLGSHLLNDADFKTSEPVLASNVANEVSNAEPQATTKYVTKNIEDIQEGDEVLAYDVRTNEPVKSKVSATFHLKSDHLRYLTVLDANGSEQTFQTTDTHPFWVNSDRPDLFRKARDSVSEYDVSTNSDVVIEHDRLFVTEDGYYVEAKDLKEGDHFIGPTGESSVLVKTWRESHPEGIDVYNFKVADNSNYFVIANYADFQNGTEPVLAHNGGCGPEPKLPPSIVVESDGVKIVRYLDDHKPPHLHLIDENGRSVL